VLTITDGIVELFLAGFTKDHFTIFTLDFSNLCASITLFLFFGDMIENDFMKDLIFGT
jgi:hypothetical protein